MYYVWLGLFAAAATLATSEMIARVVVRVRARRFDIDEWDDRATDRSRIAQEFRIPEVEPAETDISRQLVELRRPLQLLHEDANRLQGAYHTWVARCVSCLGIALGVLGLSLTILRGDEGFKAFATATEVLALAFAFYQWWAARVANHRWVAARTKVELLRQWTFLYALLQPASAGAGADQTRRAFAAKAAGLDETLFRGQPAGLWQWIATVVHPGRARLTETIEERVRHYWDGVRAQFAAMPAVELAPGDIHFYLRRRPVRQLAWFRMAHKRLQGTSKLRERVMAVLFLVSFALALAKALAPSGSKSEVTHGADPGGLTFESALAACLLAVTTIAMALTSIYLSRNDRSLLHRYAAQERRIEDWLGRVLGNSATGELPQPSLQERFRHDVLAFEDLMVDELIDWLHISAHDALELAP